MTKTMIGFRRLLGVLAVAALALTSIPMMSAYALTPADVPTPPAPGLFGQTRLELAWARQQYVHDRMAVLFDNVEVRISQGQALIDRAKAKGKDVTAVQAALDAFAAAVKQAQPIFESMNGIVASHQGFDANGKVTDLSQALNTVQTMAGKIQSIRGILVPPAKALRDAIQAFRQANSPNPTPTATPGA